MKLSLYVGGLAAILGVTAVALTFSSIPRLVGYGCSGASGAIYANEEDDFPNCTRIEKYRRF